MNNRSEQSPTEILRKSAMQLSALSRNGLAYCKDPFDIQRFHEIAEIGNVLQGLVSEGTLPVLEPSVVSTAGYTTPKVDVRGAVFNSSGEVLLVREMDDDAWSMPGGWCDILETPRQAVGREVQEETGLDVEVVRLAAVLDREMWDHEPAYDAHIYKLFFICEPREKLDSIYAADDREISDAKWFPIDGLPKLSLARLTEKQVQLVHKVWQDPSMPTVFD